MLRTKIVCTLGPATSDPQIVRKLVRGGLDVARINMAHGERAQHRDLIASVRAAAREVDRPIAVLADLRGPKIRVGSLPAPIQLVEGARATLAFAEDAKPGQIPTTYESLAADVGEGDRVLLDDGLIELECVGVQDRRVLCRVVEGGVLTSNKGINIPSGALSAPSLTPKDRNDLDFALEEGLEYVGLSFVRQASDVEGVKQRVDGRALVVAKIEMARAMAAIQDILDVSDLIMIARGDLGVELPFEEVPLAQKRLIQRANFHGRPVITATQMLDSMIEHRRPTRAEASDVANAVLDGTDAVMLSGETATGEHPLLALEALVRIVGEIEASGVLTSGPQYLGQPLQKERSGASPREHAVALATLDAVRYLEAPAVVVLTRSGFSARLVSSYRPPVPIFAVTTDVQTYGQMSAVWGVRPVLAPDGHASYESLLEFGRHAVLESGTGRSGDAFVVTSGFPFQQPGTTNTLRVERL